MRRCSVSTAADGGVVVCPRRSPEGCRFVRPGSGKGALYRKQEDDHGWEWDGGPRPTPSVAAAEQQQ